MEQKDCILLFDKVCPHFFEREDIRSLPEGEVFEEMILPLDGFDPKTYDKALRGVSFGFYEGSFDALLKKVARVEPHWPAFYDEHSDVYCGYADGEVVSFCIVEDMGTCDIGGRPLKIGGPGCVGTLPEYRNRGIGLTMVQHATRILRERGYDYSYIHYTGVAPWYGKLGYETIIKWDKNGILQTTVPKNCFLSTGGVR